MKKVIIVLCISNVSCADSLLKNLQQKTWKKIFSSKAPDSSPLVSRRASISSIDSGLNTPQSRSRSGSLVKRQESNESVISSPAISRRSSISSVDSGLHTPQSRSRSGSFVESEGELFYTDYSIQEPVKVPIQAISVPTKKLVSKEDIQKRIKEIDATLHKELNYEKQGIYTNDSGQFRTSIPMSKKEFNEKRNTIKIQRKALKDEQYELEKQLADMSKITVK